MICLDPPSENLKPNFKSFTENTLRNKSKQSLPKMGNETLNKFLNSVEKRDRIYFLRDERIKTKGFSLLLIST